MKHEDDSRKKKYSILLNIECLAHGWMCMYVNAYHFYDSVEAHLGLQVSKLIVERDDFAANELPFIFWKNRTGILRTGLN